MRLYITFIIIAAVLTACNVPPLASEEDVDLTALAPTLNAQFTQFAQDFDQEAAATLSTPLSESAFEDEITTPFATDTPDATTSDGTPSAAATQAPTTGSRTTLTGRTEASGGVACPGACPPATAEGNIPGAVSGGDTYATTLIDSLSYGESATGTLGTNIEGHNWEFLGTAGDEVTITVAPTGGADVRARVIGPNGVLLIVRDGGLEGSQERINLTLQQTGVYTVRLDVWGIGGGGYTISVEG